MNIEETNKLIVQFMGYKKCTRCENCGMVTTDGKEFECERYLKYHSSWDILMPVVEKIHLIDDNTTYWSSIRDLHIWSHIEEVYQAVVNFINYYNARN